MSDDGWLAAAATLAAIVLYELWHSLAQRRRPRELARSAHASLREEWFSALSAQAGSEILAVQTLRNSLMSATMTASTAVLGLMGSITLAAPSLHATFDPSHPVSQLFTPRLLVELMLLALLFSALASSVMAVRYYTHASFIGSMPTGSAARGRWADAGGAYVRKAGLLYSWSLRSLLLIVPLVAYLLHAYAGPAAAVLVTGVLYGFDRTIAAPPQA
ncbi:DUF599 domain-containing protein [Ramlibacter sp. MMS24-I3-19]|uniref:DUF599 domain-containing protein n=1 Tax=Ramlibacter sp. MMS24-I3-19 TaxID=3416606 RepID=UPI003D05C493